MSATETKGTALITGADFRVPSQLTDTTSGIHNQPEHNMTSFGDQHVHH